MVHIFSQRDRERDRERGNLFEYVGGSGLGVCIRKLIFFFLFTILSKKKLGLKLNLFAGVSF